MSTNDNSEQVEAEIEQRDPNVMPMGGEIHFKDDRDAHVPDRIEFLRGGWVRAIYKHNYRQDVHAPDEIKAIHNHTNALEGEDWW